MSGGLRHAGFDAKSFRMANDGDGDGDGDAPKAVGAEGLPTRSSSPPPHPTLPSDVAGGDRQSAPSTSPHPPPPPPQATGEYAVLAAVAVMHISFPVMVPIISQASLQQHASDSYRLRQPISHNSSHPYLVLPAPRQLHLSVHI